MSTYDVFSMVVHACKQVVHVPVVVVHTTRAGRLRHGGGDKARLIVSLIMAWHKQVGDSEEVGDSLGSRCSHQMGAG